MFSKSKVYEVLDANQTVNGEYVVAIEKLGTARNKEDQSRYFKTTQRASNIFLSHRDIKTAIEKSVENSEVDKSN